MVEIKNYIMSFLLIGLFLFVAVQFASQVSIDNNTNVSILDNTAINKSFIDIQAELRDSKSTVDQDKKTLFSDRPEGNEGESINLFSIIGIAGNMGLNFVTGIFQITRDLVKTTLGIDNDVVFAVFGSMFVITLIFLTWRVIRTGT